MPFSGFNGGFWLKVFGSITAAGIIAVGSAIWTMNAHMAALDERLAAIIWRSDRNDVELNKRLDNIDKRLNELRH